MTCRILGVLLLVLFFGETVVGQGEFEQMENSFEFAFLTDIHIRPDMNAPEGFQMAIDKVNQLNPDFVLTGGDLVFDALRGNQSRSDSLFLLNKKMCTGFEMPVYNCLGNHDLFAVYEESPEDETHPDYKYGMFERHFGDTYYSFNHKGWHFIVLNSLETTENKRYKGYIHQEQLEWLKSDLKMVDQSTPIVVVSHIPLISTWQFVNGGVRTVENSAAVFELFKNRNLKLLLQGHIHWKEYGFVNDRFHYITGGSIAGNGWKGRRHNTKEGFVYVKINDEDISWEYVDHGWEQERLKKE
ncbi:3',5'-cyclic AMP phosphodiesterase CpdA [Mariniphaga anaerophila]|uniref:3',5'-cyclic AMP phosphodiesterase CpdA n=1 Tax=Mariniphaga anaerophila TaxID=1484053 RepID=A0A1M5A069_9BACT|nr:metallophosphoesterase [Mariniphaga anaerophila]SHF23497.1 3',5'-cyclic AMP phosphodiesterase CpdA [Mariniphaga anaerophila]